jgi:triosephosphate isomerase (TIM)
MQNNKKVIIANWKMNFFNSDGTTLAENLASKLEFNKNNCEVVICPNFSILQQVSLAIRNSDIFLGSQDCSISLDEQGAYTGDISSAMLASIGCSYAIVGHSERRCHYGESNELVARKAGAAASQALTPIICIGESREQKKQGKVVNTIIKQLANSLPKTLKEFIIAYEPVWAIGTGSTPSAAELEQIFTAIKEFLQQSGYEVEKNYLLVYGGSVGPETIEQFLEIKHIDGFLVGSASIDFNKFDKIVRRVSKCN